MRIAAILHILFLFIPLWGFSQTTWHVPDDFPTIQGALSDALVVSGDTVIVRPGTYKENLDFPGKALWVKSELGFEDTVINGQHSGSVVSFTLANGSGTVLQGFTISNGTGTEYQTRLSGGGVFCVDCDVTLKGNRIRRNTAKDGGGIFTGPGASVFIENNLITLNETKKGGAIFFQGGSSGTVTGNTITRNVAKFYTLLGGVGGGIFAKETGELTITDNVIEDNTCWGELVSSAGYGGGIFVNNPNGAVQITDNVIRGNDANYGGGIYCLPGAGSEIMVSKNELIQNFAYHGGGILVPLASKSIRIVANTIWRNEVTGQGGGIYCHGTLPLVSNNLVISNRASYGGGVIFDEVTNHSSLFSHNTVVGNSAMWGGGIRCNIGCTMTVLNSILWNNTASTAGDEICLAGHTSNASELCVDHCDVQGGEAAVYTVGTTTLLWNAENIDTVPLFADPGAMDFHLTRRSPCINMGRNEGAPPSDMDGDPRPNVGTVDMGADEFTGNHPLEADLFAIPQSGGSVAFTLHGGMENALRPYLLLGGFSGSVPGTVLPGGQATLPVNFDLFTALALQMVNTPTFKDFAGALDASGKSVAQMNWPGLPGVVDVTLSFAYTLDRPYELVSNPVEVLIFPAK